jgi:hypothetical protein
MGTRAVREAASGVGKGVGVEVGVGVDVEVGEGVQVAVAVGVRVAVGVGVRLDVGVGRGVRVRVGLRLAVGVLSKTWLGSAVTVDGARADVPGTEIASPSWEGIRSTSRAATNQ